jgi:hypothetical protein
VTLEAIYQRAGGIADISSAECLLRYAARLIVFRLIFGLGKSILSPVRLFEHEVVLFYYEVLEMVAGAHPVGCRNRFGSGD